MKRSVLRSILCTLILSAFVLNGRVAIAWGVYAAPESFLVNPQGIIVYKQVGEITPDIWREQFMARIDAAGPSAGGGSQQPAGGAVAGG